MGSDPVPSHTISGGREEGAPAIGKIARSPAASAPATPLIRTLSPFASTAGVQPNFHFGYAEKGLTWARTGLSVDDYVAYWERRIDELGVMPRQDWGHELKRLVADLIIEQEDLSRFRADFTQTQREKATPRPGLRLSRRWRRDEASSDLFVAELRKALRAAVTALGEYQLATELAGSA